MTEGEKKKGFAGLSSLESSVNPIISDPLPETPSQEVKAESEAQVNSKPAPPPPISRVVPQYTYSPEIDFIKKYWLWIAAGIFLIYIFASQDSKKSPPSDYSASNTYTPVPSYSPPPYSPGLTESKPTYGSNNVLSASEIYYCKAEELRIESNKQTVDRSDDFSLPRFNQTVQDYNSRCSQYRYHDSAMNSANAALELNRYSIEAQGRARM